MPDVAQPGRIASSLLVLALGTACSKDRPVVREDGGAPAANVPVATSDGAASSGASRPVLSPPPAPAVPETTPASVSTSEPPALDLRRLGLPVTVLPPAGARIARRRMLDAKNDATGDAVELGTDDYFLLLARKEESEAAALHQRLTEEQHRLSGVVHAREVSPSGWLLALRHPRRKPAACYRLAAWNRTTGILCESSDCVPSVAVLDRLIATCRSVRTGAP